MTPPPHLPDDVAAVWTELAPGIKPTLLDPEFEAYCGAVARLRDAQRRIAEEGMIVPDSKANPMPHPALAVEKQAQEQLRRWGSTYRKRRP